jgi:hypothetical protein
MDIKIEKLNVYHEGNRGGEPKLYHDKMYIWVNNQTIIQNLMGRGSEPYKDYKKFVIPKVMEKIKEEHPKVYELIKDVKWGWNKHCGCSMCPCSPGFISDRKDFSTHQTIHITI